VENPIYLGDAVYAYFDGYGLELRLNRHDSECVIYLEPEVMANLVLFNEAVQKARYRDLAKVLDRSVGTISNWARAGMPRHDTAAAKAWAADRLRRKKQKRRIPSLSSSRKPGGYVNGQASGNGQAPAIAINTNIDVKHETLAATIPRLRRLEKATHDALMRSTAAAPASYETALYRRQHLESVRVLYDCQAKLIKIEAAREKLASIDRTLMMIDVALNAGIAVMRRLPELGRDSAERKRLEEFAKTAVREFELGLAGGNGKAAG
jgi:hypothetical protein